MGNMLSNSCAHTNKHAWKFKKKKGFKLFFLFQYLPYETCSEGNIYHSDKTQ